MLKSKFASKKEKIVIIGLHGLGNKPAKRLLRSWWKKSIMEGLKKIEGTPKRFKFSMTYWADIMYPRPLDPRERNPAHVLHIEEPYIAEPIPSPKIRNTIWHGWKMKFDRFKDAIFLSRHGLANFRVLFDIVVRKSFKDLAAYYDAVEDDNDKIHIEPVKKLICQRLKVVLRKYRNHRIMVLSHSMGSLIAYDVFNDLPKHYKIDVFVSFGSPLGLPVLREKIAEGLGMELEDDTKLPTPECVSKWYNFSDKEDQIAVYDDLATYYTPNSTGAAPIDINVYNDYKEWVTNNAHNAYGYLRTPEMAAIFAEFIGIKEVPIWERGKRKKE